VCLFGKDWGIKVGKREQFQKRPRPNPRLSKNKENRVWKAGGNDGFWVSGKRAIITGTGRRQ